MDPFVMANDAQFFAPGSDEASYKPADGPAYAAPIRVIRGRPDAEVRFGDGTRVIQGTNLFLIRRSEVLAPQRGDLIGIGPARFKLQGEAQIDLEGLNWRIGAVEA